MPLRDELRPRPSDEVIARVLEGDLVLLDLASGKYFGINAVGARTWELIGQGRTVGEIRAALLAEHDVAEDVLARDLEALFDALVEKQLVTWA